MRQRLRRVFHIVKGAVQAEIAGEALPTAQDAGCRGGAGPCERSAREWAGTNPAFLFQIDDAPRHSKIGIYERFSARASA
jgi:hypothetical protein